MGCTSSSLTKDSVGKTPVHARRDPVPIPAARQQEAKNHFGLDKHVIIRPLGVGGTGETYLSKRKDNGVIEAVKVIKRPIPASLKNLIINEIILQSSLAEGHINLVEAHEVLLTDSHLCLFMEFIAGGTLTDYVSARVDTVDDRGGLFLDEDEARYLFQQCIEAVDYCHKKNVAHRDLKLDNTLLDSDDPPCVKICDFGFAKLMGTSNLMTNIGTPVYMAPQQIQKGREGYDGRAADVWACGVLLFVMLLGAFPFEHSTASATDEQRAFNEVHFEQIRIHWNENERNKEIVKKMSPECVDLLDRIFTLDEKKRIKIPEIKQHPWYVEPLSEKYDAAMRKLMAAQAKQDQAMDLARESGSFKAKEQIVREVVTRACSKFPSPATQTLEGQEISLLRVPSKLTVPGGMAEIAEVEPTDAGSVSVRVTQASDA